MYRVLGCVAQPLYDMYIYIYVWSGCDAYVTTDRYCTYVFLSHLTGRKQGMYWINSECISVLICLYPMCNFSLHKSHVYYVCYPYTLKTDEFTSMYVSVSTIYLLNLDKYFLNFAEIAIIILYRSFLYFYLFLNLSLIRFSVIFLLL